MLPTVNGGTYNLNFWLQHSGGTPSEFQVFWGGNNIFDITNPPSFPYTLESFSNLTAASSSTELNLGFGKTPVILILMTFLSQEQRFPNLPPCSFSVLAYSVFGDSGRCLKSKSIFTYQRSKAGSEMALPFLCCFLSPIIK
jgi:hypothetical protein